MTDRAAALLHVGLAAVGIGLAFLFLTLLLLPASSQSSPDPSQRTADAQSTRDAALDVRNSPLAWVGAGLAVGAAIGGGIGALVLYRREGRRIEEGR